MRCRSVVAHDCDFEINMNIGYMLKIANRGAIRNLVRRSRRGTELIRGSAVASHTGRSQSTTAAVYAPSRQIFFSHYSCFVELSGREAASTSPWTEDKKEYNRGVCLSFFMLLALATDFCDKVCFGHVQLAILDLAFTPRSV